MPEIHLSDNVFSRLQSFAQPFVDTPESVIVRALDSLEQKNAGATEAIDTSARAFNPAVAPNLSFTTVKTAKVDNIRLRPGATNWNSVLLAVILAAAKRNVFGEEFGGILLAHNVVGKKESGGFKFVEEAGISVQGQDANNAWRASHHLASIKGIGIELTFLWQDNPKAAHSGMLGSFHVPAPDGV